MGHWVAAAEKPPKLPGTYWQLLSLTEKNEKITDAKNPADVEFLKDGKWGILHYRGRREADGELYIDASWTPASI